MSVSSQYLQYNNNQGLVSNGTTMGAYATSGSDAYEARTFMRFGGLDTLRGRTVTKAELSLSFNFGSSGYTLAGKYLAAPWNASASTFGWSKRTDVGSWAAPGSGGADWLTGTGFQITGFNGSAADTRKVLLDPAVVQAWIDNPQTNWGFVLVPTSANQISWVRASEDSNANLRPTLQLTFQ